MELDHDARTADLCAQARQRRSDRRWMMREIVVHLHAVHLTQ